MCIIFSQKHERVKKNHCNNIETHTKNNVKRIQDKHI